MDGTQKLETHRIAQEASRWLQVLETTGLGERLRFAKWLKSHRGHGVEFLVMAALDQRLAHVDPHRRTDPYTLLKSELTPSQSSPREISALPAGRIDATRPPIRDAMSSLSVENKTVSLPVAWQVTGRSEGSRAELPRRSWPRVMGLAAAACLLGAAVLVLFHTLDSHPAEYATAVGERRVIHLEDGSIAHLNTNSLIEARFSARSRDIRLVRGEALFSVERDAARPFRVTTEAAVVQAVGTQFNVYRRAPKRVTVSVLEGRVALSAHGHDQWAPVLLDAGQEAEVLDKASMATVLIDRNASDELTRKVAWTRNRIYFTGQTLAEVLAEFNRYNRRRLMLADPSIGRIQLSGMFAPEQLDAFVASLESSNVIPIVSTPNVIVLDAVPARPPVATVGSLSGSRR